MARVNRSLALSASCSRFLRKRIYRRDQSIIPCSGDNHGAIVMMRSSLMIAIVVMARVLSMGAILVPPISSITALYNLSINIPRSVL